MQTQEREQERRATGAWKARINNRNRRLRAKGKALYFDYFGHLRCSICDGVINGENAPCICPPSGERRL